MPKSAFTPEFRANVSQEYLDGKSSCPELASKYKISQSTVREWIFLVAGF